MKVTWIIENYTKEKSFAELTKAIEELKYPLIKIDGDFSKEKFRKNFKHYVSSQEGKAVYTPNCTIVNGTIKMCKILKEELEDGHFPIIYSNFEKYKCSSYCSHFGPYLFNDKYCLMSLSEIERQKFDVWGHYGKDGVIFIRPDSGEKTFQAGVLDIIDFPKLYENNQDVKHDLMLVSTPKNIKWEGRFVVSKKKEIIANSTYRFQNMVSWIPSVPTGATKFCKEILNNTNYHPDSVFCLDLCEDSDGNFWMMELTSFSSAGLYSCKKEDIVEKVSAIAWEDFINNKEYDYR